MCVEVDRTIRIFFGLDLCFACLACSRSVDDAIHARVLGDIPAARGFGSQEMSFVSMKYRHNLDLKAWVLLEKIEASQCIS